jgi:Signal transduction histidine kinase
MAKKKKEFEKRTSWEVVITYLFVIAMCSAMFYYIYELKNSAQNQRINIKIQNKTLDITNKLTQSVHEAQSYANLYTFSEDPKHLKTFHKTVNHIKVLSDSLITINHDQLTSDLLKEINELINRKGQLSYVISRQFTYFDPLEEIDHTLENYKPETENTVFINTIKSDTIIQAPVQKSFWRRISDVFSPSKSSDSIIQVTTSKTDTIHSTSNNSDDIVSDLKDLSEKAKGAYNTRIETYEKKTKELIAADNELSVQISTLLLKLNQEALDSSIIEIEKSEAAIAKNIHTSTIIGASVLGLIIIFIILIISDVNKGYRARKAAEEAKKKTEEIMESRHKLLLTVSHDIKTPLTSILGNLELMNGQNQEQIKSMQHSAEHILNLLTDLLEYSSLEQGKLEVCKSTFNLSKLFDETYLMFLPIAKHKNLKLDYIKHFDQDLFISSDRLKIKQITSNLISNCIKYTLEGSVHIEVSCTDDVMTITIIDTGVGIPQDKLEDIFKPFVRIETYNSFAEGNGYGMSVVKGLVDLLEGEIDIESEVNVGSRFVVKLPAKIVQPNNESETEEDKRSTNVSKPLQILIIDDDNTLLSVMENMLKRLGIIAISCRSESDLKSAIEQIDNFDYILTDREMGAITGNDILSRFKAKDQSKPVILMTARVEYDMEKASAEGFDGFLEKPFSMKSLAKLFKMEWKDNEAKESDFSKDFPELNKMMNSDAEAITNILQVFVHSTADDLVSFNEIINNDDFKKAQSLCHKMLPIFKQLERNELVEFLSKMNALKGQSNANEVFPDWKNEAFIFMSKADDLIEMILEKYGID